MLLGCSSEVTPPPSTTGTGGTAGDGGATSTTSGQGGGGAEPTCLPPAQGCGTDEKCTLVDEAAGVPAGLGCVEAGPRSAFAPCDADAVCGAGLWCDYTTAVCKPLCNVAGLSCGAEACAVGRDSAGLPLAGLGVCLANCQPLASNDKPCSDDAAVTCFYRADELAFDCGQGAELPWPSSCTSHLDCGYGLGCIQNQCRDWCPTIGSECFGTKGDGSWYCENFMPCGTCTASGLTYEGAPLGVCQ